MMSMGMATVDEIPMHGVSIDEELDLENSNGWGCSGCFQSFWPKRRFSGGDDQSSLLPQRRQRKVFSLVITPLNKLKQASELLAGPKWKTLLRKIGAQFNRVSNKKRNDFQYDSFNYTLNFDDGKREDDEDAGALGFSSRFAPPVNDHPRSST